MSSVAGPGWGRGPGPRHIRHVATLVLAGALAAASAAPTAAAESSTGGLPGLATIDDADVEAIVADIDRAVDLARTENEALRSERLHRDVVIEQVGPDPAALLEWVAGSTSWVPYRGTLRGPDGVLMDRSGNSMDRALLLAKLLEQAGHSVRLAHRQLSPEDALALVMAAAEREREGALVPVLASASEVDEHQAAVDRSSAALIELIEAGAADATTASALEAAADHWWVQVDAGGTWLDLDPTGVVETADAAAGATTSTPAELPDDLRHRVTLRVVAERMQEGAPTTFVPLEHTYLLGDDGGIGSLELTFDGAIAEPPDGELDLDAAAAALTHWRPTLSVGGLDLVGDWFTWEGRLEIPAATPSRDLFGDAEEALGGLSGDDAGEAPSALTAVWLEYETSGPGLEPQVERRDLLRHPGPTPTDVSAALLGTTDILVQSAEVDPDAFSRMLLESTIGARNALIALTFMAAGREDDRILPALQQAELEPADLWAMAMARTRWSSDPGSLFIGRPNVWTQHSSFERSDAGLVDRFAVDIVHNDIGVVPSAADRAGRLRLEQGVLDTLVEHALMADPAGDNTWARFDAALRSGERWQSFSDPALLTAAAEGLPAEDVARMRASLEAGQTVVSDLALSDGVVSWWRIDRAGGRTLGMGANGWGTASESGGTYQIPAAVIQAFNRTQGIRATRSTGALARNAARYARNNPTPQPGTMTVFELVSGTIARIYIL